MEKENQKSKLSKTNKEIRYINGMNLDCEIIEEDKINGIVITNYNCCNHEYIGTVKFNESRSRFQAIVEFNGRKQSLSFFPSAKEATKNIEKYIAYINGGGNNQNINNRVGD